MMLIARTQRHLFGTVVLARIAQDDHMEEEEDSNLPVIPRQLSAAQQEAIITHLLIYGHAVPRELPRRATRIARWCPWGDNPGCPRLRPLPGMR